MAVRDFYVGLLHFNEPLGIDLTRCLNCLGILRDLNGDLVKIHAEHILIHETSINHRCKYQLIIDRGSHVLQYAVGLFMMYAFQGVYIINNPLSFHYFISNKDVGFAIANSLGINVPETYVLPSHTTPLFNKEDFVYHRNFNWEKMLKDIRWPCYIKPAEGRAAYGVHKVFNVQELIYYYNTSGEKIMTVQSAVPSPYEWHIRCLCVGRKIVPIKYFFRDYDQSKYVYEENFLSPELCKKAIDSAKIINRAFGYEMNSVEFIIDHQEELWAIDFNNPIPDGRLHVLGEIFYEEYIDALVQRVKEIAFAPTKSLFLPELNRFSEIAQRGISKQEKFIAALEIANEYYEPKDSK